MVNQQLLPLMGRLDGPSVAPCSVVARCTTYRQAVRLAWALSRVAGPNQRRLKSLLAQVAGMYAPHVSDYLNPDDAPHRRSLPADRIPPFEGFVGNTIVSQWLALQARLTVLEELQASRLAA